MGRYASERTNWVPLTGMCDLYSITTNQAAIIALFRAVNRYVGNLPPMPGVLPEGKADAPRVRSSTEQIAHFLPAKQLRDDRGAL
jgi:hypothetical protein